MVDYLQTEGIECEERIGPEKKKLRYKIWIFLESPRSSPAARYLHHFK